MNFDLTEDQKMLVDTAATFAKKSSPVERFRELRFTELGYDPKVWKQMGELGWLGVMFPEEVGGFGGSFVDASLVIEQLGKNLVPEPYLSSVVMAGRAILLAGDAEQQQRYLAPLCEGDTTLAFAYAEPNSRHNPAAIDLQGEWEGEELVLHGTKTWVLGGHAADHIVVTVRTDDEPGDVTGLTLVVVDSKAKGVRIESVKTMDGQRAAMIHFESVRVSKKELLGTEGNALPTIVNVLDGAAAAACAESLGIVQHSLDMTVEYLKTREQFGTKIGVFQALQHRAVDMFVEVQGCKSLTLEACIRMDEDNDNARMGAVSAAKCQLTTGGRLVTEQAIQLHGGIGVTDEHDIGLYFKRLRVLSQLFGDEDYHVERYASLPDFTAQ
jgi:alkylation response protein AidB-like acyl-CoA dehydrogenase